MKVTYYGHSCFAAEVNGHRLLFDPFIAPNELAHAIDVDQVDADFILISHGHQDHIHDALPIAKRTAATVVSNFEIYEWLEKQGLANLHPLNHGGTAHLPFGSVKFVNAIHSSALPDGSYGGNPGGFVVQSSEGCFYYSGDTALTHDMKLIKDEFTLDFAVLCIGDTFTMGAADAAIAATFVGAGKVLAVHYDTFPPIRVDREKARTAFQQKGVELFFAEIGATLVL